MAVTLPWSRMNQQMAQVCLLHHLLLAISYPDWILQRRKAQILYSSVGWRVNGKGYLSALALEKTEGGGTCSPAWFCAYFTKSRFLTTNVSDFFHILYFHPRQSQNFKKIYKNFIWNFKRLVFFGILWSPRANSVNFGLPQKPADVHVSLQQFTYQDSGFYNYFWIYAALLSKGQASIDRWPVSEM